MEKPVYTNLWIVHGLDEAFCSSTYVLPQATPTAGLWPLESGPGGNEDPCLFPNYCISQCNPRCRHLGVDFLLVNKCIELRDFSQILCQMNLMNSFSAMAM